MNRSDESQFKGADLEGSAVRNSIGDLEKLPAENLGNEFDLGDLIRTAWRGRIAIACLALAGTVCAVAYSFWVTPIYHAEAILSPKESKGGGSGSGLLSNLGGLGGFVAQMGFGGASLEKLEILLGSHGLATVVVRENQLLPELFPGKWDGTQAKWKSGKDVPSVRDGAEFLTSRVLKIETDQKKNILILGANIHDSVLASRIVNYYMEALNSKLRNDVRADADSNQKYLQSQLDGTFDPLIREKILNLIGGEVEKAALLSSRAFDVLEAPLVPKYKAWPNKRKLTMLGLVLGVAVGLFLVLARNFLGRFGGRKA